MSFAMFIFYIRPALILKNDMPKDCRCWCCPLLLLSFSLSLSAAFLEGSILMRKPPSSYCLHKRPIIEPYQSSIIYQTFHQEDDKSMSEIYPDPPKAKNDIGSSILSLAIPALITLAIDPLMSLTDTILVGRSSSILIDDDESLVSSSIPLAAIGSASALLTFTFYLFNFLSTVVTPLVSQQRASGQTDMALQTSSRALSLAIALGIVLCISLQALATPLLHNVFSTELSMGPVGDMYAQTFVKIRALASPAIFLASAATGILRGYALDTRTPLFIVGLANIFNFIFDLILIPSYPVKLGTAVDSTNIHFGFGLGPTGAAISTTAVEWLSAFAFLGVLGGVLPSADSRAQGYSEETPVVVGPALGSNQLLPNHETNKITIWPSLQIPPWSDVQPLILASSSVLARSLVLQIILAGAAAMAARSGPLGSSNIDPTILTLIHQPDHSSTTSTSISSSASIAAHQIALQLWFLCSFVCDALAAASQTLIADALGRDNAKDTREIAKKVFMYSLLLGLVLALVLKLLSVQTNGFLITFFTQDRPTQEALIPILGIVSAAQPLNSLVFAADGVLQGASAFRFQAISMALSVLVAIITFVGLELGADGCNSLVHVWDGLVVLQVMRAVTSFYKLVDRKGPIDLFGR